MRLPTPLLRNNPKAHKRNFGHVLVIAGSPSMLGAGALTALSAMRAGAGLTTFAVPKSLNLTAQKKIRNVIMTLPLPETKHQTLSDKAYPAINKFLSRCQAVAIGPGLSLDPNTQKLVLKLIRNCHLPMVIDADALNALAKHISTLDKASGPRILTPHEGEMGRLLNQGNDRNHLIQIDRKAIARQFAKDHHCVLLLKGHRTVVADHSGKIYTNKNGNVGMATAGSGDVLTGIIAALLAQGLNSFEAAKWGAFLHGQAGDLAARKRSKASMIAEDIVDEIKI